MSKNWRTVEIGTVLDRSEEWIDLAPAENYREVTVRLWGKGVVLRGEITGAEIAAKRRLLVRAGQFILSRIDARNGAFGVIPESLDGAIVSNDFPVFRPNPSYILPSFLAWMSRTNDFVELCKAASEGTTNRVRIKEERFLSTEISLPPLEEQRRIVSRIEELAAKIKEAKEMREQAGAEIKAFFSSASSLVFESVKAKSWPVVTLAEATERITKGESPEWQGFTYQEEGPVFIRSENVLWGQLDISHTVRIPVQFHKKLSRSQLKNGDVLINLVGASIGRSAVFSAEVPDANVNQAVAVISPDTKRLNSRYLMTFLNSSRTQGIIHGGKVETARPNISLGDLRVLTIPLAPLGEQHRIVGYLDDLQTRVNSLKKLQTETATELDALMPSILSRAFRGEL